ncbi:MAG: hypothetical protein OEY09_20150, partial [Gammaproteobacteria bacterium]|nr:hypothetical protein [Gammaproteobacteria bacterium]
FKNIVSYLIPAALILLSNAKAAEEDGGYFMGVGLGSSQFQLNQTEIVVSYSPLTSASSFNESETAFNVLGGIRFDEYLPLESELIFAGDITVRDAGRTYKLFNANTADTRLFARLEVHLWSIHDPAGDFDTINSGTDLTYSFGTGINVYGCRSRHYLELHRKMLAQASAQSIEKEKWLYGFRLALYDLAVNRIPMYTLIHRIKPQAFLPRMTQTWYTLFREFCR